MIEILKVKNFFKNHIWFMALVQMVRKRKDIAYIKSVAGMEENLTLLLSNAALSNRGEVFYLIDMKWNTNGFFAIMRTVLTGCAIADSCGFKPYICIYNSVYNVPGGFLGKNNMFEYYYKPISDNTLENIVNNENYIKICVQHISYYKKQLMLFQGNECTSYMIRDEEIFHLAKMRKKYFILDEKLEKELNSEINNMLGSNKTIGVHFRSGAWSVGLAGHPIPVTIEQCSKFVDEALNKGFEQIFFATDDLNAINYMVSKYRDKIKYYRDVIRTSDNKEVQFTSNNRENDGYFLGLEVLRDMYTLSKCDGLIAGLSQVSFFTRIQKCSYGLDFEYLKIIDNGVYSKNSVKGKAYRKKVNESAANKISKLS